MQKHLLVLLLLGLAYMTAYAQLVPEPCGTAVTYQGDTYQTKLFGSNCWMLTNMRATKYADNTDIPDVKCYENDCDTYLDTYGRLYTWPAATRLAEGTANTNAVQGICPDGWAIPTKEDFMALSIAVTPESDLVSPAEWVGAAYGTSPADGFSILPGGYYSAASGFYEGLKTVAYFWTSTSSASMAPASCMFGVCPGITVETQTTGNGFSVRCVRHEYNPNGCNVATIAANEHGSDNFIDEVKDADDNSYEVVEIQGKCWTAANLRNTDGMTAETDYYNPDGDAANVSTNGLLYTHAAAANVCPTGWHLATQADWTDVETYFDMLNAPYAGLYTKDGYQNFFGHSAYFWNAEEGVPAATTAYYTAKFDYSSELYTGTCDKDNGASVRCVRD